MCLAVPGKIISFKKNIAEVDFNGTKREISIDLVPEAKKMIMCLSMRVLL